MTRSARIWRTAFIRRPRMGRDWTRSGRPLPGKTDRVAGVGFPGQGILMRVLVLGQRAATTPSKQTTGQKLHIVLAATSEVLSCATARCSRIGRHGRC